MHLSEEKLHDTAGPIQQLLQHLTVPYHSRSTIPPAALCNKYGQKMLGRYKGLGSGMGETGQESSPGTGGRGSRGKGRGDSLRKMRGGVKEGRGGSVGGMGDLPLVRAFEASASMLRWLTSIMGRCCFTYPDTRCPACHSHLSELIPAGAACVGRGHGNTMLQLMACWQGATRAQLFGLISTLSKMQAVQRGVTGAQHFQLGSRGFSGPAKKNRRAKPKVLPATTRPSDPRGSKRPELFAAGTCPTVPSQHSAAESRQLPQGCAWQEALLRVVSCKMYSKVRPLPHDGFTLFEVVQMAGLGKRWGRGEEGT